MDSKELKMSAFESDKPKGSTFHNFINSFCFLELQMEASVLDRRFSKNAEHLPIKKRRFLFRTPSPPHNTAFSEGPERDPDYKSSSQVVQPQLDASCQPAASPTVADLCQSGNIFDSKMDGEKFVEAGKKASEDEDICGLSLVALAAGTNGLAGGAEKLEAPVTVKVEANYVQPAEMSTEETDLRIATTRSKDVVSSTLDCSSPDKSTVDNTTPDEPTLENSHSHTSSESECSRINQVTTNTQKSAALDDRLNWDLNTVMDAWEEPLERDRHVYTADATCSNITYAEGKNSCTKGNSEGCERKREHKSVSENIGSEMLPVGLKSLAHTIESSMQEERKPDCNTLAKLLSPVICTTTRVAVNKIKPLHDQPAESSIVSIPIAVPATVKLEYPECDVSAKRLNVNCKSTGGLSCPIATGLDFSLDYSLPPSFDHSVKVRAPEENIVSSTIVGSGNNVNHAITTAQATECKKLHLSLVTAASPVNGVHQSRTTFDVDDKAKVKKEITSDGVTMENLIGKGTDSSQDVNNGNCKELNQSTFGSLLAIQSSVSAEGEDHPSAVSSIHDVVCSDAEVPIKAEKSPLTSTSGMTNLTETMYHTSHESETNFPNDLVSYNKEVCVAPLDNGSGYENFPSDIQAGSEVDNVEQISFGYDSQFEDGEFRESSIQTWEGYEGEDRENEHGIENQETSFHLATLDGLNDGSQCLPESSSRIRSPDVGSQRGTDEISSVILPEKLDSSDQVSGSEPNETKNGTTEVSTKDASESDQWKMNVSGSDFVPENHSPTRNATKMRDFGSIKFSSRIGSYGPETEDPETKTEGSRFYRREPFSRIGEPSTRDAFLNRGRFKMQGCRFKVVADDRDESQGPFSRTSTMYWVWFSVPSIRQNCPINADDRASGSIRETGITRPLRRGKYSPQVPASGRGGGPWNCSPGRERNLNRLQSPPYPGPTFRRSLPEDVTSVDNLTNEVGVDPNDDGRPVASSYITRQSFRNRLLANREEDDFRARLGLRPSGDNRFGNVGRGRSPRYGSRHNGGGPRGQYYAPASGEYDEPSIDYSHSFPTRRRCFSPAERRENHPCAGSTSPRSRTRSPIGDGFRRRTSRSPNFRSDTRIRRPRSPNYRHGFEPDHAGGYNLEPRNNTSPPNSRWVKYKQRSSAFDRRSPPPIVERLNFYDPSRKTKQNENYRSGHPGRFSGRGGTRFLGSESDDHGCRRGGFVKRYDIGRPVKHFQYDEEDGYGPVYDSRDKEAMELHGRGNPKEPYGNGTESRFPRRPREEREN
ncbi:hypothetical protein OSB04_022309 [Centaurea solstitialis]|uniref:Uncharacterized protein n=1 Tax=Centaurea solstitialis TaxID=347529 RepID=A0AA38T9C0_9ASTR|nr:hypothetical protein OSB04_022309 [Centaurea solstitialis]